MRGAAALAASAAVAAGLFLAGCGAGQVTQTEGQRPPISGVDVNSADGKIFLRNLAFQYPGPEGFRKGGAAPIQVRIVNLNQNKVRLVSVTTEAGTAALGGPAALPSSTPAPATSSASPSGSPSGSPSASRSGSAAPSGSPSASPSSAAPTATPSPTGPPVNRQISVEIGTRAMAILDPSAQRYLVLTDLREDLMPGQSVMMTFRFDNGTEIEASVPMAVPLSPLPRSPLPLEDEE
jgi:hypothetical protein